MLEEDWRSLGFVIFVVDFEISGNLFKEWALCILNEHCEVSCISLAAKENQRNQVPYE